MAERATISVLIVEDKDALREAVARSLTGKGCRVATATSGVQGLDAVRSQPFDVVISDIHTPDRGGLWLWGEALAVRPELRGRFMLVSSEPLPEPRRMALFIGSERLLIRPLSPEAIWREVQEIVDPTAE